MKAQEYWKKNKGAVLEEMAAARSAEELLASYRRLMEAMRMSLQADFGQDDLMKQSIAILFREAREAAGLVCMRGEPTVVSETVSSVQQKETPLTRLLQSPFVVYALAALGVLACVFSFRLSALGPAIVFAAIAALTYFKEAQKPPAADAKVWKAVVNINKEALDAEITRQAQQIDAHIEDLSKLLEEARTPLPDLPLDREVMALCQYVWTGNQQGLPLESAMSAAESVLDRSELAWTEYSEKTRRMYDVLPTKKDSRTVYPAIIKKSDGSLVCKGQRLEKR